MKVILTESQLNNLLEQTGSGLTTPEAFLKFASTITLEDSEALTKRFPDEVKQHFKNLVQTNPEWAQALTQAKKLVKNNLRQNKVYVISYDDAQGQKIGKEIGYEHNRTPIKYSDVPTVKNLIKQRGITGTFISAPGGDQDQGNVKFNNIMNIFYDISPNY